MTSTPRRVAVTVYPVMGTPPSDDGAEKVTHASVFDLRERPVSPGAPGTVATGAVTGADGVDAAEVKPAAFVAVTVNVYGVPAVSSVTVIVPEPAWDTVPVPPAGLEVAVYVVIGEPPSDEGAVNVTFADVDPAAATAPMVGAPGTVTGVTGADGADAAEVPVPFVAVAVNVYAVPFDRPVTSQDPDSPVTVHAPPVTAGEAVTA